MVDSLLELKGVTKEFGKFTAVNNVNFQIKDGEGLTALIGPNGAGKTTMYNIITGSYSPTNGEVYFRGENITDSSPSERSQRGIGRSFQITNIFDGLTAYENLRIPVIARSQERWNPASSIKNEKEINDEAEDYLEMVGISDIADMICSELSYGDKRRVEIGVTLATDPNLVLLDEPTAGMNPSETTEMVNLLQRLYKNTNISFFMTEHDMDVIFSIASRIMVLHTGRLIADGTPREIQENTEVRAAYLGEEA